MEGATALRYGLTVDNMGTPNCSLAVGVFQIQDNPAQEPSPPCERNSLNPGWLTDWSQEVRQFQPQVSVFLARLDIVNRDIGGKWEHIGDPSYDAYLEYQMTTAVEVLSAGGGKVVFLTTPYYDTGEQPNGQPWPEDDPARVDEYNAMLRRVAAQHPGVVYVLNLNKIADPDGHFQPVIDGVPVRYTDGIHWTFAGDAWLAPRILPQIALAAEGTAGQQLDITDLGAPRLVSSDTPYALPARTGPVPRRRKSRREPEGCRVPEGCGMDMVNRPHVHRTGSRRRQPSGSHPTVHCDLRPGDVGSGVGKQEADDLGHL